MMRRSFVLLAIAGLIAYFVLFFSVDMPGLSGTPGKAFVRGQLLLNLFVPESFVDCWFGNPPSFSVGDRVPVALLATGILAWAGCLGWLLLEAFRLHRGLTRLESGVFAVVVGLNAVSTYVLAIGLMGWLGRAAFVAPAVLTFAAAAWLLGRRKKKDASVTPPKPLAAAAPDQDEPALVPRWLLGVLAAPFVAMIFLGAMLPPVEFDVREYHLQVPKEFYQEGRIGFLPHNVYGNMPLGTEMLSLLAMVLAGDWWLGALAGKTVIASYAVLTALGLLAAGRRLGSTTSGGVAALVSISTAWVIQVSTLGLVDAALGCYLFLAFYAVCLALGPVSLWDRGGVKADDRRNTRSTERLAGQATSPLARRPRKPAAKQEGDAAGRPHPRPLSQRERGDFQGSLLLLAGYLAGGAASCKYPGLLFVVVPLAVWVFFTRRPCGDRWRPSWRPAGTFLLAAAAGCGLWFAKNWILAGNPTYPLLYSVFGGQTWTPEKDRQWNAVHRPHDFSPRTLAGDAARVALTSPWLSPLVMPLAALGFAGRRRRAAAVLAAYFVLAIAAWWLLTHRIDRFWIPVLPLAAMAAGLGAAWSQDRVWRYAILAFLVAGTAANFVAGTAATFLADSAVWYQENAYFAPLDRLRTTPRRVGEWHAFLNREARHGRVLLVGDAQPFDLEMPVLYNTCFDDSIFEQLVKGRSPQQVRAAFAERGITHVYVDWDEIARYRRTYGYPEFVQPAVFEQLVADDVLIPVLVTPEHGGIYRVRVP